MKLKISAGYPGFKLSDRNEIYNDEEPGGFRFGDARTKTSHPAFPEPAYGYSGSRPERSIYRSYEEYSAIDFKLNNHIPNYLNPSYEIRSIISKEKLFPIKVYNNFKHITDTIVNELQNMRTSAVRFKIFARGSAVLSNPAEI